jgi:hypothetical protein
LILTKKTHKDVAIPPDMSEENATTHMSEENVVTEGTNPDLAYDVKISMKQHQTVMCY